MEEAKCYYSSRLDILGRAMVLDLGLGLFVLAVMLLFN
jgi:hypothetical protein